MASFTFRLPDIGEGVAEAEIVAWHVVLGDHISKDQPLADVMTDKATVEMESPVDGIVTAMGGDVGDVIAIGSTLVVIETVTEGAAAAGVQPADPTVIEPAPATDPEPVEQDTAPAPNPHETPAAPAAPVPVPAPAPAKTRESVLASPAVRQRARDLGIDLAALPVPANGRLRHSDLDAFLAHNAGGGYGTAGAVRPDEVIRVVGMRRRIADNMAASKRHIPHFTYVEEIDVTDLEATREALNAARGARPKLTMLPFLITAICRAVPDFPMMNARFDDEAGVVTRYGAVHMGMAAQTPAGLMVPVLRNAQDRNLWQLATEVARLAEAARDGSISSAELSGSTITLTSLGPLGGVMSTPVINRPEVAIIGPNRVIERPAFITDALGNRQIAARKLMNLSISCDHRVVDGHDAASFVQRLKSLVERPALLLAG